jgi:hygromycin-B 7''-O-kinase
LGAEAWPSLPELEKELVLAEIGETIAEVQRAPVGALARIEPDWSSLMRKQIEGCRARRERLGLPQKFLNGLDELLRDAASLIALDKPPVILTGEYIPENFLLSRDGSGWHLAGLFDFGDVMTGRGEYDLLGPSAFMTAGAPRRVRRLFERFGYSATAINADLKRRLMALMLLHRASDPARQICIDGWQEKAADLFELQDLLWPI